MHCLLRLLQKIKPPDFWGLQDDCASREMTEPNVSPSSVGYGLFCYI